MEIIVRVVEKLGPLIKKEVDLHHNSDKEAKTLADNFMKIQMILEDAEMKQLRQPLIKKWLEELQDLAYNVEDALDDCEAQNQALQEEASSLMEKVCLILHYPCSCFNKVVERRTVALDIKGINESVERMYSKGVDQLQLNHLLKSSVVHDKVKSGGSCSNRRTPTTSDFIRSEVHGRGEDVKNVKKMLLVDDGLDHKDGHEVICIVGSGGLGKTTLAKIIYDDDEVKSKFPSRIWVCVSKHFNELAIATDIYEQLEHCSPNVFGLQAIKNKIRESLEETPSNCSKKYLLVLDDVWIEDSTVWKPLQACLSHGAKESKILVTTRNDMTAMALGVSKKYPLGKITEEDCWSIIRQIALPGRNEVDCRQFAEDGLEIAKKCDGTPLAANFLGGHLKDKKTLKDWKSVLDSEIWKLEGVENHLFRHFFLSYDELKPVVKRCFAYCAVFPKVFEINVDYLIRIWMAQGFLSTTSTSEAQGYDCVKDLVQRSFFQDLNKDDQGERVLYCMMHDIVHDFAQYLNTNARHLWWDHNLLQTGQISNADKLRSLFCRGGLPVEDIASQLKCVRALSLFRCGLKRIPEEIGNLIHLRYLDLSYNLMKELPETICNLCNLQSLILILCLNLSRLPEGISNLGNLRYLICFIEKYPSGIANLTNLRVLEHLYVSKGFNDLSYLQGLNNLEGSLEIKLRGVDDVVAAELAALWEKTSLDSFSLNYDEGVEFKVVEALRPHQRLQTLKIISFGRIRFPGWIATLEHLKSLRIYFKGQETPADRSSLPPLWKLPFLEYLLIDSCVEHLLGNAFYGLVSSTISITNDDSSTCQSPLIAFPALKTLELTDDQWITWRDMEEKEAALVARNKIEFMPILTELNILCCSQLEVLPLGTLQKLPSLKTLHIEICPKLRKKYVAYEWTSKFEVIFKH